MKELLVIVGLFGLLMWGLWTLVTHDARVMEEKRAVFMQQCLLDRKPYDCQLQWDTFAAAYAAEQSASVAAAVSAANLGATTYAR